MTTRQTVLTHFDKVSFRAPSLLDAEHLLQRWRRLHPLWTVRIIAYQSPEKYGVEHPVVLVTFSADYDEVVDMPAAYPTDATGESAKLGEGG